MKLYNPANARANITMLVLFGMVVYLYWIGRYDDMAPFVAASLVIWALKPRPAQEGE